MKRRINFAEDKRKQGISPGWVMTITIAVLIVLYVGKYA